MDFPPPLLFLLFRRKGHGGGEISVRKGSGRGLSSLLQGNVWFVGYRDRLETGCTRGRGVVSIFRWRV